MNENTLPPTSTRSPISGTDHRTGSATGDAEAAPLARTTTYASELATAGGSLAPVYVDPITAMLERLARPVAGGVR